MAMSFSRPDPGAPAQVADATFSTARRGYDQTEVRDFLQMVAAELSRLTERVRFLEREVDAAHNSPDISARLDEETLTRLLGEETARVLGAARASATEIREKAEQAAAQLVGDANDEAARVREEVEIEASRRRADSAADAEAEVEMAKQQGREMVNEARAYRERVLSELSRRRELAREQIEQLVHGRDRLVAAFERARLTAVDVMADLEPLGAPDEYVNLAPTTGPVPVMVARTEPEPDQDSVGLPAETADAAEAEPVETEHDDDTAGPELAVVDADADETTDDVDETTDDVDGATADDAVAEVMDDESAVEPVSEEPVAEEPNGEESNDDDLDLPDAPVEASDVDDEPGAVADEAESAPSGDDAEVDVADHDVEDDDVVVDLFARLRSETDHDPELGDDGAVTTEVVDDDAAATHDVISDDDDAPADLAEDGPFESRDAALTPLIVAAARKLKRVLADEQNDVLDALRTAGTVTSLDELLPVEPEQAGRYVDAISDDLLLGAQAGAGSTDADGVVALPRTAARNCVDAAGDQLAERLIAPMRERLARAVGDADGDVDALTKKVRAVYREVKTRHIDDVLDDVARAAYGAGRSAAITTGEPVVWVVDERHPACPDCDDNALAPPVPHGEPFPTGHVSTPAHPGCRCMLHIAPR